MRYIPDDLEDSKLQEAATEFVYASLSREHDGPETVRRSLAEQSARKMLPLLQRIRDASLRAGWQRESQR